MIHRHISENKWLEPENEPKERRIISRIRHPSGCNMFQLVLVVVVVVVVVVGLCCGMLFSDL